MGNSSGKDNNNTTPGGGGGGGGNNNPDKDAVLTFNPNSPNNTNIFILYNNLTLDYMVKILKSIQILPITNNYTIFFPGYNVVPTKNKTKFISYVCNAKLPVRPSPVANTTNDVPATIDKVDTQFLTATITQVDNKCTIFTSLPSFSIIESKNMFACSRDASDSELPNINIFTETPQQGGTDIVDCFIDLWSEFKFVKPEDALGTISSERLFKEDPQPFSTYTFVLEKYNVDRMYKDNRYYYLLPRYTTLAVLLQHMNTVGVLKNACTIYTLQYFSGQTSNVILAFLKYFASQQNLNYIEFYTGQTNPNWKHYKVICFNSSNRNKEIITFNNCTLDLAGTDAKTNSMFYIKNNKIEPASKLYGIKWSKPYAKNDPPTEIYAPPNDISFTSSISYIYYHLVCDDTDYYMVPQIINVYKKKYEADKSYTGFSEKFSLTFTHNNYDEDDRMKNIIDSIPLLRIISLTSKNKYVLTNILTSSADPYDDSVISNYYYSIKIASDTKNRYNASVNMNTNGALDTFYIPEESKTNLINNNPITATQGKYFGMQYVEVPYQLKNDTLNTYVIVAKQPNEATLWNFCRQCYYKQTWMNFIIITDLKIDSASNIISNFKYINSKDYCCVYPDTLNSKVSAVAGGFMLKMDDYYFYIDTDTFDDDITTSREEHIGISFKEQTSPWLEIKDIPFKYRIRENSYNVYTDMPLFVGAPIGPLTFVVKNKFVDKIDIVDRKALLRSYLYYIVIDNLPDAIVKPMIEFAEQDFAMNAETSKLNLLFRPNDPKIDVKSLVKIGKIHDPSKFIIYLYNDTTLSDDKILTLTTPRYAKFQFNDTGTDLPTPEEMLKLNASENPFIIQNIKKYMSTVYQVFRKDTSTSKVINLTLQLENQLQLHNNTNEYTTIITSATNTNNAMGFYITKTGNVMLSVLRSNLSSIACFLEIVITTKILTQVKDQFIIVISFNEDDYLKYHQLAKILQQTVPCKVYEMVTQNVFVLTNTKLNFDSDSIYTAEEKITFVNYRPNDHNFNYIVNKSQIVPRTSRFEHIYANFMAGAVSKNFEQLILSGENSEFSIISKTQTPDYPLVNFYFINNMSHTELKNISEMFSRTNMKQNIVIVSYDKQDYINVSGVSIRKHLAVLAPPTYPIARISWDKKSFYVVRLDDNRSNGTRFIEFVFVAPDNKYLTDNDLRTLLNERSFVVHDRVKQNLGVDYGPNLCVLINDVSNITYSQFEFHNLNINSAPLLSKWVSTANNTVTYIRPIDRTIMDGGNLISDKWVILFANVKGDINDYELMNLIVHLYQAATQCCIAVIFNNNQPPKLLSTVDYKLNSYHLNNNHFTKFGYNYIYHPTTKFTSHSSDPKLIELGMGYIYYDDYLTYSKDKTLACADPWSLRYTTGFTEKTSIDNKYSKFVYDLIIYKTDAPV